MSNRTNAKEWLQKAWHDLSSAHVLYEALHYTDTIGGDLQQAIEKMLKSFPAYENKPIKKTHNLLELAVNIAEYIRFDEAEMRILGIATLYYVHDRYPIFQNVLPDRSQIRDVMDFADRLFVRVCGILKIDEMEVRQ